jgi:hypothetical protein
MDDRRLILRLTAMLLAGSVTLIVLARGLGSSEPAFAALLRRDVVINDAIACWIEICPGITALGQIRQQLATRGSAYGSMTAHWVTDGHYMYTRWLSPDSRLLGRITSDLRGPQWVAFQIGLSPPDPPLRAGDMIRLFGAPQRIAARVAIESQHGKVTLVRIPMLCFRDGVAVTLRSAGDHSAPGDPVQMITFSGLSGDESCLLRGSPWRGFGALQAGYPTP